jgi:hypothetical protein
MLNESEILSNMLGSASQSDCRNFPPVRDHEIILSYDSAGRVHSRVIRAIKERKKTHLATEDATPDDQAAGAHTPRFVRLHSSFVALEYLKCDPDQQSCLAKRITSSTRVIGSGAFTSGSADPNCAESLDRTILGIGQPANPPSCQSPRQRH